MRWLLYVLPSLALANVCVTGENMALCCNHSSLHRCRACEGVGGVFVNSSFVEIAGCQRLAPTTFLTKPRWPRQSEVIYDVPAWEVLRSSQSCLNCYVPLLSRYFWKPDGRLGPSLRDDTLFHQGGVPLKSVSIQVGWDTTTALTFPEWPSLGSWCIEFTGEGSPRLASGFLDPSWSFRHFTFVGSELLQVEAGLGGRRLNHFANEDLHVWSDPDTGLIMRLWQSKKGVLVFPEGLQITSADEVSFTDDFFAPRCQPSLQI